MRSGTTNDRRRDGPRSFTSPECRASDDKAKCNFAFLKRAGFILLCLLCAAAGFALGRYAWAAPVEDAPVMRPSLATHPSRNSPAPDIKAAFAELRSGPRRAALLLSLAARGDRRQLPALIESCAHDTHALQLLADLWRHADPAAFIKALAASKAMQGVHREKCADALWSVLEHMGKQSPDDAWSLAETLPGTLRRMGMGKLVGERIEADPRAGLEFRKAHPSVVPDYVDTAKIRISPELLPLIQSLPDCPVKWQLLRESLKELPLAEALTHLEGDSGYGSVMTRSTLIRQAAKESLDDVMAFHATATGPDRAHAARFISDELLDKDPAAAVTWAQEHLYGSERRATIRKAAENLQSKDPAAAEAARALLPENQRATVE